MRKILVICIFMLSACGVRDVSNPINDKVQHFQAMNQRNEEVTLNDLENKIWMANLIFTSCETVCPPMTVHMKELQDRLIDKNIDIEIISFSVDPTVDTPDKLQTFIKKFQGNESNWQLLTGYSQAFINEFAKDSFRTIVDKPTDTTQIIHGTSFYLVDKGGVVKKSYDGVQNPPYDDMIEDIQILLKQ